VFVTGDGPRDETDIRSSDAEREATALRLRDAAGEGRLTLEELAQRIEAAYSARTRGDLARLVADLPAAGAALEPAAARSPAAPAPRRLYGILGGDTLTGPVRLGAEVRVINVMGGADVDLTEAVLLEGEVTIRIFSVMGGSKIVVPHGVHVEHTGRALLGWDEVDPPADDQPPPPGAPVVRIRSVSIMAGNDVKRGPQRPWRWPWQRREPLPPG
jgi:Domain of unknown function (DUF1707)/Cell wall-active antibiotics response 4TMS YvqF